jgi:transposase
MKTMIAAKIRTEPKTNWRPMAALDLARREKPANELPSLTQAVQAAVREIGESALHRVAAKDAGMAFQPKALLALLAYCYAREVYSSADVEDMLRRDAEFRYLCHNEFPAVSHIRQFRRHNREAIHTCLTAALCFLARQKVELGMVTKVSEAHMEVEADRRIINAMFVDMEMGSS